MNLTDDLVDGMGWAPLICVWPLFNTIPFFLYLQQKRHCLFNFDCLSITVSEKQPGNRDKPSSLPSAMLKTKVSVLPFIINNSRPKI